MYHTPHLTLTQYTSIQERIKIHSQNQATSPNLMEFQEKNTATPALKAILPFSFQDYKLLVDWTGGQFRENKPEYIAEEVPSLVQEAGLNPANWIKTVETSSIRDQQILGAFSQIKNWAKEIKKLWLKGQKSTSWKYAPT